MALWTRAKSRWWPDHVHPRYLKGPWHSRRPILFCKGLGQIYNGQIAKGLLLMCIQVVNVLLCLVLIGLVMFPLLWLYGIWDAYDTAKRTHIVSEVV